MKSVLIISPFRNEDHSIPYYLKALKELDYPPELIDVYWLENDSSDNTLALLQEAADDFNFNSLTLKSRRIIGPVKKRKPGGYWKDAGYGRSRIRTWMVIWNDVFFPLIHESTQDYILMWYADAVPPPNVIHEYLKVYEKYPAGWVGGSIARRVPLPRHIKSMIESPWPPEVANAKKITLCRLTGHVWLMPQKAATKCKLYNHHVDEMHLSIIADLAKQRLYVYYQPSIYLQHVSTDGIIHHLRAPWK